ncbi:unnamed protein product [Schistosoma rodhaini]|uniref:BZIP domain-containing protein n=2 Tax=Schistosoma rodhaini TaxID=6188 RepID=A0AA85GFW5_9TREM|nr:unnamed protein product [Schistosoma rodhaini]
MATLYTGNNHVIDTSLVSKTLRNSTSTTTVASIPDTKTIITSSTQISEDSSSKQIKSKSTYPSTLFSPHLVDHHQHHNQPIDLMSNPNGGLALASALAGILGLPFLPSILPPTSLNSTTMTTTAATLGIEKTIPSSTLDTSPSDITTFLSQHQQTQSMLPLWLSSNYQNNNENVDVLNDNLITNNTTNNNNTPANVCCKNSNGQIADTLSSSGINLNISTMNTIHSMNPLYDNINNSNNNTVTNNSNNNSHLFNNFSFILPSQQTCSDVSSDTGSVQSPFTPVQQTTQSTSIHLTNSNTIDSNYSTGNPNNKFNTAMLSSIMTSSSSSTTTTPIPVTSQQINLDSSSINNSLLNSIERDRKQREFIPDSKKDDKYWERRRKNNEAAKRSREKRRQNDILMECRINQLQIQNHKLHHELIELKLRFNIPLNDEDKKFMENQSSTLDDTQNDVYNGHHDHHNNSDGELKLSEMDCCMMSTTKSRNDSLSMDDSQNEMLLKSDHLSSVSPTPPPLLPQSPTTTTMLMTTTTATATYCTTATVLPMSTSSIDPLMNSVVMTTTSSSSSSPLLLQSLNRMNCEQMNIELSATNTTTTTSVLSNNHNHTVSSNFLFPHLNSLDNTDLLTLKRIFSSLGVGCLSTPPTTSPVTMNHSSSTSSSASPLIAAAAAAAAVAAVATNGGCTMPLSPIPGNNNNSICTTSTTTPFNNLSSLNTTAALLLRQAGLMPASTTPPPPPMSLQSTLPIPQHPQTSSCGLQDNISIMKNNNKNDKLSFSSSVIPLTAGPTANVGGGGRCSSVHSVKSDLSNNSNDYFESPLDLSLCLQIKSESHNSEHFLSDSNSGTSTLDKRYQDRRRRNNEAVRRCRENKRARLLGRTETTEKLQSENRCLRNELSGLSMEVKALRKLLTVSDQQQDQQENTTTITTYKNNCISRNTSSNGMNYSGDDNEIKLLEETTTITTLKHDHKEVPLSPTSSLSLQPRQRPLISISSSDGDNEKEVENTLIFDHETEVIETMNDNNNENTDDDIEMPTLTTMNVDNYSLNDDYNLLRFQTHTDHPKKLSSNNIMETSSSDDQINKNVQVLLPNEHSRHIDDLSQEKPINIAQLDTNNNTNDNVITTTNTTSNENISSSDNNKMMECTKSDNDSRCGVDVVGNSISIAVTNNGGIQSTDLLTHVNKNVNDKPTTVILRGRRRTLKTPIHNKNAKTNINPNNHHDEKNTIDTIDNMVTSSITQTTDLNDASNTSIYKQHTPSCNTATNIISSGISSKSENSYILPDKSTYFQLTNEYSTRNSGKEDSILT